MSTRSPSSFPLVAACEPRCFPPVKLCFLLRATLFLFVSFVCVCYPQIPEFSLCVHNVLKGKAPPPPLKKTIPCNTVGSEKKTVVAVKWQKERASFNVSYPPVDGVKSLT